MFTKTLKIFLRLKRDEIGDGLRNLPHMIVTGTQITVVVILLIAVLTLALTIIGIPIYIVFGKYLVNDGQGFVYPFVWSLNGIASVTFAGLIGVCTLSIVGLVLVVASLPFYHIGKWVRSNWIRAAEMAKRSK